MTTGPSSLKPASPARASSAMVAVPRRQAAWVTAQVLAAGGLVASGLWASQPELALSLSLGAGASAVNPRRIWALPLVTCAVALGGLLTAALEWSPLLGAGAVAGLSVAWLLPEATDRLDYVNGALATAAAAALGLWAADKLLPDLVGSVWGPVLAAGLVGFVASQALVPLAVRFDRIVVPTKSEINRTLQPAYRAPALKAIDLFQASSKNAPDHDSRRGLAEVTTWVFKLEITLQTLDEELATIDPTTIQERIRACEEDTNADAFTRERRQATAAHLRRLLDHRQAIATERTRTDALVDYALAFLEEARAGLAVARELPNEALPDRLPEVLGRLRSHAAAGDARRRTARELADMRA